MSEVWEDPDSWRIQFVCFILLVQASVLTLPDNISSSVKHLEGIKNAGYDMPSVNQIEVFLSLRVDVIALNSPYGAKAPSVLPTKAYRHLLSSKLDYCSGILPPDAGTNGSPRHPGSSQ
jgi:hypothetical protein